MLVEVRNFGMQFGKKVIIRDLSFGVQHGEVFGLLGSNGSGKTTTLRALLGTLSPTRGVLHINGASFHPRLSTKVGYLPEQRGLYQKDAVLEVMTYFGELKGLSRRESRRWSTDYLQRVGLGDKARVRLDRLSGGQQQKIQLAVAMMGNPELLILDEPAKGLDPVNRQLLMDLVAERQGAGAAVILVSHNMDEVERLCARALLLKDGRAEAYGTIAQIKTHFGTRRVRIQAGTAVPTSPHYEVTQRDGDMVTLAPDPAISDAELLKLLTAADVGLSKFEPQTTSLESIFLRIYGGTHEETRS